MGENETPEPPRRIGRYEIRKELGRGMMGVVYEAHDPVLGRTIALKTIELAFAVSPADREQFEQRFFAEARAAARLAHPGIVIVHDVGRDPEAGSLFIALEYLAGRTLADAIKDGRPLEWREALRITARVAEALHHAHSKGVIHRDIKPANIMLLPSGEPKIMDFGIAKIETARLQLTSAGQFFGTPLYMSPEQALGREIDPRSDLFSLGVVTYALLTGQLAFAADDIPSMIRRVIQENPPPASSIVPGIPPDIDYLVGRALAKSPDDRYRTGQMMVEDAEDILAGRPPRHRATSEPQPAEGTLVSASPGAAAMPDVDALFGQLTAPPQLDAAPSCAELDSGLAMPQPKPTWPGADASPKRAALAPAARPRTETAPRATRSASALQPTDRPSSRLVVAGLSALVVVLAAALILFATRRGQAPEVGSSAKPSASPTTQAVDSPSPLTPAASPSSEPAAAPTPEAPASFRQSAALPTTVASSADRPARLFVDFEHPLKSGTLRIWLDDEPILDEELDSRAKKIVAIKIRKGGLEKTLEVAPGRHEVRVQVAWDDNSKSETIPGTFKAGSTRHLEIRVGRLRKNLSVEWK